MPPMDVWFCAKQEPRREAQSLADDAAKIQTRAPNARTDIPAPLDRDLSWRSAHRTELGAKVCSRFTGYPECAGLNRAEAERFLKEFRERLAKFGLELHPDKTRLIEFGRYAARDRKQLHRLADHCEKADGGEAQSHQG